MAPHPPRQDLADSEDACPRYCAPLYALTKPVQVGDISPASNDDDAAASSSSPPNSFFSFCSPSIGPLLFNNESSDARDHCANERTFLSYLRLAVNMAVISVAITLSFHLQRQPSPLELRIAKPLGAVFWALSFLSLLVGVANYIRTVNKYSQRAAIVQTGWRTQLVMGLIAACIIGTCVILLVVDRVKVR